MRQSDSVVKATIFNAERKSAVMVTGQISLNTVNDQEMIEIIKAKEAQAALQLVQGHPINPQNLPGTPPRQTYNGVVLGWTNQDGLKALGELLVKLSGQP